eukprot:TRINITY_DN15283_c0_g1_i1.p1 TRINITY_DN15283_c0_g1~~TRINITY_DN15283_c0_g1_i1.p1  ORF type:complete len:395 (+),score=71.32 TRINITY_DN15283_c0_g1_i1:67-1251(+)
MAKNGKMSRKVKMMGCFSRMAMLCQSTPWPLAAMKQDPRKAAISGAQDEGSIAVEDKVGVPGGGKRAILVKRPVGNIADSDFKIADEPIPEPGAGEVTIQAIYISIDPTHRIWMSNQPQYMPCVGLGTCMRAAVVGKVVKSKGKLKVGSYVGCMGCVQEYSCIPEASTYPILPGIPLSLNLSLFSAVIGVTAWVGVNICEPRAGQTMVVSGAAGAVGSVAAQLAKARGMKVVGLAGSDEKVAWLRDVLKLDGVINYKTEGVEKGLKRCCPDGVDAYFDNVGGTTLETVLTKMNRFGRIAFCGSISGYNESDLVMNVKNYQMILMRRLKVQGFICVDHMDDLMKAFAELMNLYSQGKMVVQEHIEEASIADYPRVVRMLYSGANEGKLMMKVASE